MEILKRLLHGVYWVFLAFAVFLIVGGPTYQHGLIGWFIGTGMVLNIVVAMALIESVIRWLITGEYKFAPKE